MGKKPQRPSEIVWSGKGETGGDGRAQIFVPEKGGKGAKYAFEGYGGPAGTAPPPPVAAPSPPAPPPPAPPKAPPPAPPQAAMEAKAAPKRTPERPAPGPASPARQSQALAATVVSSFVDRLTAEAARKGGSLTVADIQSLNHEFEKKAEALQAVFEASFEEYVRARERSVWEQSRQFPFDRLIVKKFSHLFTEHERSRGRRDTVSRRILPGFFMALNMMLGPEMLEECQERCRKIIDRLKARRGEQFDWDDAYADPEARAVTLDALATMAHYFQDRDKRVAWFTNLVNTHLPPPEKETEEAREAAWTFTEDGMQTFLATLFADLRAALADESGRLALGRRHGADAVRLLRVIVAKLVP